MQASFATLPQVPGLALVLAMPDIRAKLLGGLYPVVGRTLNFLTSGAEPKAPEILTTAWTYENAITNSNPY